MSSHADPSIVSTLSNPPERDGYTTNILINWKSKNTHSMYVIFINNIVLINPAIMHKFIDVAGLNL